MHHCLGCTNEYWWCLTRAVDGGHRASSVIASHCLGQARILRNDASSMAWPRHRIIIYCGMSSVYQQRHPRSSPEYRSNTTISLTSHIELRPQRQRLVNATGTGWMPVTPQATNTAQSSIWLRTADFVSLPSGPRQGTDNHAAGFSLRSKSVSGSLVNSVERWPATRVSLAATERLRESEERLAEWMGWLYEKASMTDAHGVCFVHDQLGT